MKLVLDFVAQLNTRLVRIFGAEFGTTETNPISDREEDLNPGPPDYKSSALTTWPRRLLLGDISQKKSRST